MKWKNTWKSRASSPSHFYYRSHKKAVSRTMTTTKVRSGALICCAPADDVTNLCVILASHPHKPSPPSVLSSLAFVSFLLIPGSLFVSQFPCVFVPNLLPRPLASFSLSLSLALFFFFFSVCFCTGSARCFPRTQILFPVLFLPTVALLHSVWLSSVITHRRSDRRDVRSDEERKSGCVGST